MNDPWVRGQKVTGILRDAGYSAWFVGGCVRDRLLGRTISDVDVCTQATPEQVETLFPRCLMVGRAFGVVVVVDDQGGHTEVATYRTDGLYIDGRRPAQVTFATVEEDVARRDYTINALLMDPQTGAVVDHVGGLADLEARILRVVGNPLVRLEEDRLRVLRGIRFASGLGLTWDPASWQAACTTPLVGLSRERICQEIDKGLGNGHPGAWFAQLVASGRSGEVLPEGLANEVVCAALNRGPLPMDAAWAIFLSQANDPWAWVDGQPVAKERQRRWRWILSALAEWPKTKLANRRRWLQHPDAEVLAATAQALGHPGDLPALLIQEKIEIPHIPVITANDLLGEGLRPGPDIGRWLRQIEDAQLEGRFRDKIGALAWFRELRTHSQ